MVKIKYVLKKVAKGMILQDLRGRYFCLGLSIGALGSACAKYSISQAFGYAIAVYGAFGLRQLIMRCYEEK